MAMANVTHPALILGGNVIPFPVDRTRPAGREVCGRRWAKEFLWSRAKLQEQFADTSSAQLDQLARRLTAIRMDFDI